MKTADIILWTFSLILSVLGIVFGIIASISSTRANKKIESLINTSFIADETQKYFFNQMKAIIVSNKKINTYLDSPKASYTGYSSHSTETRFSPLPQKTRSVLLTSEYAHIAEQYKSSRLFLEEEFKKLFDDISILSEKKKIDQKTKKSLTDYHKKVIAEASRLLSMYVQINNEITRAISVK